MLTEDQKIILQKSIRDNAYISYSGVTYDGEVYRDYDNFKLDDPSIHISFLPGNEIRKGVSAWRGYRDDPSYSNYGYTESEICVISALSRDTTGIRGRRIADGWLKCIETYIKNNWNNIINGVTVDRQSFVPYREIPNFFTKRMYGLETRCTVWSSNVWTDEPSGATLYSGTISGISINSGAARVWVIG